MKFNRKKILRALLWVFQIFILIILAAIVYFYVNRDDITRKLLLEANKYTQGELFVENVGIDPLVHFPSIALTLNEVKFYENKGESVDSTITPILDLAEFNISFDIVKLFISEVEITEVSAQNGSVYLLQREDNVFNLENALKPVEEDPVIKTDSLSLPPAVREEKNSPSVSDTISEDDSVKDDKNPTDTVANQEPPLDLNMEEITIEQVEVRIQMVPSSQQHHFNIHHTEAEFKYVKDSIEIEMTTILEINRLEINKNFELVDEEVISSVAFFYDKGDQKIDIYQSDLEFRNAHFFVDGFVDFKDKGNVDLNFEAGDDELAFTRLFLTSEGIDNLKRGSLYFNGTAKGAFVDQIPNISCDFGASGMNIELPKTGEYVRDLNMKGHFKSGTKKDLSKATIIIDTLYTTIPTGYVRMASRIRNLKDPVVVYDLDASFRLDNLAKFIDLNPIDSLVGKVEITDSYRGSLKGIIPEKDRSAEQFTIKLDEVSFVIPEVIDIDEISGVLSGNIDSLRVNSLKIQSRDSDLLVNGVLNELSNMVFDQDTLVALDLNIQSQKFNFPVLFRALPLTAESFPYVIRDVSIDVGVETSKEKLDNFWKVPEMDFEIHEVAASVDSLLDYVRLRDGEFKMYEKGKAYFLDFKDFKLLTDGTVSDAEFLYVEQLGKRDSMTIQIKTKGINPSQLFYTEEDTIPGLANAWLKGNYNGMIVLPHKNVENELIHKGQLEVNDFMYVAEDTISASRFEFSTEGISYEGDSTESILATLDAENDFYFRDLKTSLFESDSLGLFVNLQDGIISISPHDHETLGEDESGTIRLYPYQEPPRFELDYEIKNLPLEDFLAAFDNQELLQGAVDIKLDLDANGLDIEGITSSLSGSIYVVGDSLILQGLNLDEVIRDFRRSQSFNLVDIGAVALAGPAGIVYSKGSSYVSLLTTNKNDSTQISKFSSRWLLESGKIDANDVAFATLKNRVAAQGWLDMKTDSLDITIGVLNEKGCAIFDQRIYGSSSDPDYSKVKFLKTLLAPVTNVVKTAVGAKCDVFYEGMVTHPKRQKKNSEKEQ